MFIFIFVFYLYLVAKAVMLLLIFFKNEVFAISLHLLLLLPQGLTHLRIHSSNISYTLN